MNFDSTKVTFFRGCIAQVLFLKKKFTFINPIFSGSTLPENYLPQILDFHLVV